MEMAINFMYAAGLGRPATSHCIMTVEHYYLPRSQCRQVPAGHFHLTGGHLVLWTSCKKYGLLIGRLLPK